VFADVLDYIRDQVSLVLTIAFNHFLHKQNKEVSELYESLFPPRKRPQST
jgi:hypothetical protein